MSEQDDTESRRPPAERATTDVSTDELFEVLSKPANRYVLTYVLTAEDPVYVHELVDYVIEQTDCPESLTEREFWGHVLTDLIHSTLPKLEDYGFLDYDETSKAIRETEDTTIVLPYLRIALHQELDEQ